MPSSQQHRPLNRPASHPPPLASSRPPASALKNQAFRETPVSVEVREGEDVFLRCAVDHQQGNAQWTKDGFALGFERNVPGYPRYAYAGEPSLGEHHLVIKGVTLQDDGEYQCQVGPTTKSAPIWAAANVTVMVSPSSITMEGREGGVVKVQTGSTFTLDCLVSDARPAPKISWYRGDTLMREETQEDKLVSSSQPRLWSVRSRLVLKAVREDDDQRYSCRALHPALDDEDRVLEASVVLSVLHPPNAPTITGYTTGEILRAGERRTLTCRVVGGNPRPWVSWYWHGYDTNQTSRNKERSSVLLKSKTPTRSKSTRTVTVVQELTASRAEDGAVYECRVSNELLRQPLTSNVTITVHYPPTSVSVSGPSVVIEGEQFSLSCSTTPANPPATVAWYLDGMPVDTPEAEDAEDEVGGWVTSSHLTQYAGKALEVREVKAKCMAFHSATKTPVTGTKVISIIRAPGHPRLETDFRGQVVAGTLVEFTCSSEGGYPEPQIRLHKGEEELQVEMQHQDNVTRASAVFKVAPEDNGVKVQCNVTNTATTSPLSVHKIINVLFPPRRVTGHVSPGIVEAGKMALLTCETSASVPPSTITWRSGGATLDGATTHQAPGEFDGTVTRLVQLFGCISEGLVQVVYVYVVLIPLHFFFFFFLEMLSWEIQVQVL
ncbi:nephrin-like [Penaeus japonicus]|uniref:nephrin-like n=1 Tax=Penaeus japonicus TaxID=27405 RepID=UPI001C70DC12|nr:nephrin-like [Penaeus japonicus]